MVERGGVCNVDDIGCVCVGLVVERALVELGGMGVCVGTVW